MKYLFLFLMLSGCSASDQNLHPADPNTFIFSVGDKVHTNFHLYCKCSGVVTGYTEWADKYGNRANVSFYCPNIGWLKEEVTMLESSLTKDSK